MIDWGVGVAGAGAGEDVAGVGVEVVARMRDRRPEVAPGRLALVSRSGMGDSKKRHTETRASLYDKSRQL